MVSAEELASILALPHELRRVELKSGGATDDPLLFCRVVRAMMGMANLRDGGLVIIGLDDSRRPTDFASHDRNRWADHDVLGGLVSRYADPYIDFEVASLVPAGSLAELVVINVHQFREQPVVCKRDRPDPNNNDRLLLRNGACYVRTITPVSTKEVPDSHYMRELLDLATELRLTQHLNMTARAGGQIIPAGALVDPYSSERAEFGRE